MSGWLDLFEVEIICPFCKSIITVTIWEDGNPKRKPIVVFGLMDGKVVCPVCNRIITDDALKQKKLSG